MELGKRLKQARLEAGLSQRQLCGEEITRNMLSQIENGSAQPSMATLRYFAARLGKSVSYFLGEDELSSPNRRILEQARAAWADGKYAEVLDKLKDFRETDTVFLPEKQLLQVLAALALADEAAEQGKSIYAEALLEELEIPEDCYCAPELERRRLLCLGRLGQKVAAQLPKLDEELLIRAQEAMTGGDAHRAAALLDAAEDQENAQWNLLRGEVYLAQKDYCQAAACYHRAEDAYPEKTAAALEQCYRELEDFKMAYFYACKQR